MRKIPVNAIPTQSVQDPIHKNCLPKNNTFNIYIFLHKNKAAKLICLFIKFVALTSLTFFIL